MISTLLQIINFFLVTKHNVMMRIVAVYLNIVIYFTWYREMFAWIGVIRISLPSDPKVSF